MNEEDVKIYVGLRAGKAGLTIL